MDLCIYVSLCIDLAVKDPLLDETICSFLVQGIAVNKSWKFLDRTLSSAYFWRSSAISSCSNGEED